MESFINTEILFDPINWLIIVTVLVFVFYGAYIIWTNATTGGPLA